jgi:surface polysaccharide O-acyltransferase-like enzyme
MKPGAVQTPNRVESIEQPSLTTPAGRHAGADLLRVLATIAVITIHACAWFASASTLDSAPYRVFATLSDFSVPAFVVLAGFLLARRYRYTTPGLSFVWRRARRTIVPWLIWAPILFGFTLSTGQVASDSSSVWEWWASGGGHLYFLLIIPQLYALFPIWPRRHRLPIACAALVVQVCLSIVRLYGPTTSSWFDVVTIWYGFLLFPYWIGYFAIGIAMEELIARLRQHGGALWLGLFLTLGGGWLVLTMTYQDAPNAAYAHGTGAFITPFLPILVTGLAILLLACPGAMTRGWGALRRWVRVVSRYSLGIYIVHPIILYAVAMWLNHLLFVDVVDGLIGFVALVGITLALSIALSALIARTPLAFALGTEQQ